MSKRKPFLLLGVGSMLLMIALLLTLSPMRSGTAYAATNSAVTFANNNWACATASCPTSTKVQQGDPQPGYECAEFVARSLATEGYILGLTSSSSQSAYEHYYPSGKNGKEYDLLSITPGLLGANVGTLADYLKDFGYGVSIGTTLSKAVPGDEVVFEDSSHTPHHTALIVAAGSSTSTVLLDAHNDARYRASLAYVLKGFSYYYILHIANTGGGGCAVSSGLVQQSMVSDKPNVIPIGC